MEAILLLCMLQDSHDGMSEVSLATQEGNILEALNCDIEVLCVVQWRLVCCSALTSQQ